MEHIISDNSPQKDKPGDENPKEMTAKESLKVVIEIVGEVVSMIDEGLALISQ
jgi:hypothetical protein